MDQRSRVVAARWFNVLVNAVLALHFAHELAVPGTQALDASMLAVFVALVVVETWHDFFWWKR